MPYLLLLSTGEKCALNETLTGIGRAPDNEIAVSDNAASIYHAHIVLNEDNKKKNVEEFIIEDLGSTNKTFVNNKKVERHVLKNGDIIRVGKTRLKYSDGVYKPELPNFEETQKIKEVKTSDYLHTRKT